MAEITAKLVNELRAKTGQGMMECKKMLTEFGGDIEKAIEGFRKKGVKASLSERAASEGRVLGVATDDGKAAAIVEINCNTTSPPRASRCSRPAPRPPGCWRITRTPTSPRQCSPG